MRENYVARKLCGCMVGAISQDCDRKTIGQVVADWLAQGLTVAPASDQEVREQFIGRNCPHETKQLALF
jgi:hypothetical protein